MEIRPHVHRMNEEMPKPDTHTEIYIQVVFAVSRRKAMLHPEWEDQLYKFMCGHIKRKGHKPITINGMPDHIHILIGYEPIEGLSDLVRDIKISSTRFIQKNGFTRSRFYWQNGYGAFSYHRSLLDRVFRYIKNQKSIHRKRSFKQEYLDFLEKFEVSYDEKHLFDFFE